MPIGGIKGGGKGGRAGGAKGAGGAGRAKGARGGSQGKKVDPSEAPSATEELTDSGGAQDAQEIDSVLSAEFCARIARDIPNRSDQVKALVAEVLREKLRIDSKVLTERIAETLLQDHRCKPKLERLLSKG